MKPKMTVPITMKPIISPAPTVEASVSDDDALVAVIDFVVADEAVAVAVVLELVEFAGSSRLNPADVRTTTTGDEGTTLLSMPMSLNFDSALLAATTRGKLAVTPNHTNGRVGRAQLFVREFPESIAALYKNSNTPAFCARGSKLPKSCLLEAVCKYSFPSSIIMSSPIPLPDTLL